MKRVFSILLVVALLMGVLSANAMAQTNATLRQVGDANGDGKVNNHDLAVLRQYVTRWDVTVDEVNADVNSDEKLNNKDLALLERIVTATERVRSVSPATKYVSLGAPAETYYTAGVYRVARCAWDMIIYDNRLYVGCGDYNRNTGNVPVLSCSLDDLGNWVEETVLSEEQVGRFVNINGVLTIPGFDPVGTAYNASYYELIDGQWVQKNTLPYGLHNFDITWFQGRMYAAVGSSNGDTPLVYTEDGETFQNLPMYKEGEEVELSADGVVRSANLYVLGDEMYADLWYQENESARAAFEVYRYNVDEDCFDYVADLKENTHGGLYSSAGLPLWEKVAMDDKMFLTTGYLYYTTDFEQYTHVSMPNDAIVYDMAMFDGRLYILSAYEADGAYQVTVHSTTAANPADLRVEATYTYELAPTAFAVDEDNFFIGMGNWYNTGSNGNGTILQVKR